MKPEEELARYQTDRGSVLTIGTFDGVHKGHQALIGRALEEARSRNLQAGVVTFDKIPRTVIRPDIQVPYLCDLSERVELLRGLGLEIVVPLTFGTELSQLTAEEFMALLVKYLKMEHLVIGPGFALGRNRGGTPEVLKQIGEELGYTVEMIDALIDDETTVRSSAIRQILVSGDVVKAAEWLGRAYRLSGKVVKGHQRGKDLGFPTANIEFDRTRAIPADGVYVTRAFLGGQEHPSVTNIGDNPTFADVERCVETYIMDFSRDIYDQELTVEFTHRLREEVRFESVDALVAQMHRDVETARAILTASNA